jgi:hypothetical protein
MLKQKDGEIKSSAGFINFSSRSFVSFCQNSKLSPFYFVFFSYFTIIGSRTAVFGEVYQLHVTHNRVGSTPNLTLELQLEGNTTKDTTYYSTQLNLEEKLITFDVSCGP